MLTRRVNLRYPERAVKAINNGREKTTSLKHSTSQRLMEMFDLLLNHFGPQNWWPAENELEIMVGAVLTQNTNWKNVEKALGNLKEGNLLSLDALQSMPSTDLAERLRPAGYYNVKTTRLKNLINFIMGKYCGDISSLLKEETGELRDGLLSVKGIGPETADSIVLYAARRPVFIIDTYTHRILHRHDLVDDQVTYHDLQELFMDNLTDDVELFNEFHALIVRTGKEYCRSKPKCSLCPLEQW